MVKLYKGWIPTVVGQLSFSAIGQTIFPQKCYSFNQNGSCSFFQRRDLLDVIVPLLGDGSAFNPFREFLSVKLFKLSGDFTFVSHASFAADPELLVGKITAFPTIISTEMHEKIKKKFQYELQHDTGENPVANNDFEQLEKIFASADFNLKRNGEFSLSNISIVGKAIDDQVRDFIASQLYYFFKDISHAHQHHDPKHDSIVGLYPVSGENDNSWASETRRALFRAMVKHKRFRSERSLFSASGILAYAKSFEKAFKTKLKKSEIFNYEELALSLGVARDEMQHFENKKVSDFQIFTGFFFAFVGLFISAALLSDFAAVRPTFEVDQIIMLFAKWSAENPLHVAGVATVMASGCGYFLRKKEPSSLTWLRQILRLMQGFRFRYFIGANIVITIILVLISYFILI